MSLGIKKFVDYTTLTANEINEYLMQQTVMVFDSSAARASAFSSAAVTITEGMVSYLRDTNETQFYNGSAWVTLIYNGIDSAAIGDASLVSANTSSQLHVRKDAAGGKGGEISIVNYSNTAGSHAALNFGVDASTYGSDQGNAQVRATNMTGSMATELGFYTWNGSAFGRRIYIDSAGTPRYSAVPNPYGWHGTDKQLGTQLVIGAMARQGAGFANGANFWLDVGSVATFVPIGAGVIECRFGFSFYTSGVGAYAVRILNSASGGATQLNYFTNEAFSHKMCAGVMGIGTPNNTASTFTLQVFGNGITILSDVNDSVYFTVNTV